MLTSESLIKFLDYLAKYAWAMFVVVAFVLFIPDDAAKQLGVYQIKTDYKGYCWLILVFTGALTLGSILSYLDKKVLDDWLVNRRKRKAAEEKQAKRLSAIALRLSTLDGREFCWIQYCLFHNTQTLAAKIDDVTAQSLLNKGILTQGSGNMFNLPFHIPDDVWIYLQENVLLFLDPAQQDDPRFAQALEGFRRSLLARF